MTTQELHHFYQQRRFFILPFFVVLVLGFYGDLQALFEESYELREQQKLLARSLAEKEKALEQVGPILRRLRSQPLAKIKKPLMAQVIQAAEMNLCKVVSLQTEVKNSDNQAAASQNAALLNSRLIIKLHLYGAYVSFYGFIETLSQQSLPLRLDHFVLKDQGDFVDLALQFSAFPWALGGEAKTLSTKPKACCVRDPFREVAGREGNALKPSSRDFALELCRYVGFWEQAGKTAALLVLPDGRIDDLYPGSKVGKEGWQVLSINSEQLTLQDSRQTKLLRIRRT